MGYVGSTTRSLGQILERPCVCSRVEATFSVPIIIKFGQNVCLNDISYEFKNGSCLVKNQVNRSNLRKTSCIL